MKYSFYFHIDNGGYDIEYDSDKEKIKMAMGFYGYSWHEHEFPLTAQQIKMLIEDLSKFKVALKKSINTEKDVNWSKLDVEPRVFGGVAFGLDVDGEVLFFEEIGHSKVILGDLYNLKFVEEFLGFMSDVVAAEN